MQLTLHTLDYFLLGKNGWFMKNNLLKKVFYVAVFPALMISSHSYANCEQEDMAGIWNFFLGIQGTTLTINISPNGEITKGSYKDLLGSESGEIVGGNVEVRNNCRMFGSIVLDRYEIFEDRLIEFIISDSRTRPDTQYWVGIIESHSPPFNILTNFNAVRVLRY